MRLKFNYTCSTIDKNITDFKEIIKDKFDKMLDESSPLFKGDMKVDFIDKYVKSIYDECEYIFEEVRNTNERMREVADEQLSNLEEIIEELKSDIKDLNNEIDNLNE